MGRRVRPRLQPVWVDLLFWHRLRARRKLLKRVQPMARAGIHKRRQKSRISEGMWKSDNEDGAQGPGVNDCQGVLECSPFSLLLSEGYWNEIPRNENNVI